MNRKKTLMWIIVASIILVVLIPVVINECYKMNTGYLTVWAGSDVLSFYGNLLGSAATIIALVVTIHFNCKQICSERKLQQDREYWKNIEHFIDHTLGDIHPYKMQEITANAAEDIKIEILIAQLFRYEATANAAVDKMVCSIYDESDKDLIELRDNIINVKKSVIEIKKGYMDWIVNSLRQLREQKDQTSCMDNNVGLQITDRWTQWQGELERVHKEEYLPLLRKKREFFTKKYSQISRDSLMLIKFFR